MKSYIATQPIKARKGSSFLPKDHSLHEDYEITLPSGYKFWMMKSAFEGFFRESTGEQMDWLKESI